MQKIERKPRKCWKCGRVIGYLVIDHSKDSTCLGVTVHNGTKFEKTDIWGKSNKGRYACKDHEGDAEMMS